jgi:hypothetical protein
MRDHLRRLFVLLAALATLTTTASGGGAIDTTLQARIDACVHIIKQWAADPVIVSAVREINAHTPSEYAAMTQEKWAELSVLDPFVRSFTKNDAAMVLKAKKTDEVVEVFVSSAEGIKVAFLAKTTNWSHKGKPKHDVPMTGQTWQGQIETDKSTGVQQIQVAVPVLDDGKPIGSLVAGLGVAKLRE